LWQSKELPPAREVYPLGVRWMDATCARGRKNNQHGEPHRSLEGLDCLGMLAGNASEHAISVRQTQASVARESALRRHRLPQ